MLIAVPLFVLIVIVMPVTGWLSTLVSAFLNLFINSTNPVVSVIAGYILAATFPAAGAVGTAQRACTHLRHLD